MTKGLEKLLKEGAERVGAPLTEDKAEKIFLYLRELIQWNERINLTSTSERRELLLKHFIDSLSCVPLLPNHRELRLIDVGTGAGFPGVVLKIYRPDIDLALLDSSEKRCAFLDHLVMRLGLNETKVLRGRAEDYGRDPEHREIYDVAVSRAVAHLRVLVEYCLPFLRLGGVFIAQKGPKGQQEMEEARKAIEILGGKVAVVEEMALPEQKGKRILISLEKDRPTPIKYPRRPGVPRKGSLQ
ncbi:16S rRNA (guanine(527)-N(7))-methyltransferase RsmG [candidate division NPL-UPA2 bacterium]|nr:16S rRNA (guanine(527)-N(7))-methyltransferase RsmG [candidate division NPL-UPA2 bacterium]